MCGAKSAMQNSCCILRLFMLCITHEANEMQADGMHEEISAYQILAALLLPGLQAEGLQDQEAEEVERVTELNLSYGPFD